jgi:hypothetical protein
MGVHVHPPQTALLNQQGLYEIKEKYEQRFSHPYGTSGSQGADRAGESGA